MSLAKKLKSILRSAKGERPLLKWLKEHPTILTQAIPFGKFVAAEFPFGSDFRADFVVLGPFSGGWDIHFIELEPPNVELFTASGKPARRLADAVAQVDSWKSFIERNRSSVVRELSKYVQKREIIYGDRGDEPVDHCGWHLHHPKSQLNWQFEIVVGRLSDITDTGIERKSSFYRNHEIDIMTYDRLVRAAEALDEVNPKRVRKQRTTR